MSKTKNSYARLEIETETSVPVGATNHNTKKVHSSPQSSFSSAYENIRKGFTSLNTCPKELYVNFFLKYCESYGYFALSQILVIYLHDEFGTSDIEGGVVYGVWGLCISFWGLLTSFVNDNLGVRKSLLVGFSISLCSSLILAFTTSKYLLYFTLFCILPLGTSMGIPMLTVGIKRYTTVLNRGFAFGLYYAVMNVAAFASGPVVDVFNIAFKGGLKIGSVTLSGNRLVILTTTATYALSIVVTYRYLREIKVSEIVVVDNTSAELASTNTEDDCDSNTKDCSDGELAINNPMVSRHITRNGAGGGSSSVYSELRMIGDDSAHGIQGTSAIELSCTEDIESGLNGCEEKTGDALNNYGYVGYGDDDADDEDSGRGRNDSAVSVTALLPVGHRHINSDNCATNTVNDGGITTRNPLGLIGDSNTTTTGTNSSVVASSSSSSTGSSVADGVTVDTFTPKVQSLYTTVSTLAYSPTFWRFSVLTLFLINLRTIFRHLDATLPTYLIRCFGSNYPKGMIYSINPFMIIWLTPVVAALTTTSAHYDMIKYGGYLSAISPVFMVFSTSTWAVVMFVVLLSLGEAIWSPRIYDYTMSIAPEGREASFSALAAAPLFAAKVPVGLLSGYLLSTYIPEGGSNPNGSMLWLIIGVLTMSSPILITVFESCVREPVPADKHKS